MRAPAIRSLALVVALALTGTGAARAAFHLMQIEQVVAGTCGDPELQAVQLRMRAAGQSLVASTRLVFHDEAGSNPTILYDFTGNVSNGDAGDRILVATAGFGARYGITPDATITTPIPASLFDAGRLTFENDTGSIYWSLSWGGASYTGLTTGLTFNDMNGDFGPPFAGALPSSQAEGLLFDGLASDPSTTNADDYVVTVGGATVTNNMGSSVVLDCIVFADGFEGGTTDSWSSAVP